MAQRILIIEDDDVIMRFLILALQTNGYEPLEAKTGLRGMERFLNEQPDLVLLDLGLPDLDGMDVLSSLRAHSDVPIIIVSARGKERDKVMGLDAGADDFLTKPFNIGELFARIRVVMRRHGSQTKDAVEYNIGELSLDLSKRKLAIRGQVIHLTPIEYKLLSLLIQHAGKVLTHSYIQKEVWGYETSDDYQSLRVFMAAIRRKIETDTNHPRYIVTEVGVGYRFLDE